jgi:hypothetical protein
MASEGRQQEILDRVGALSDALSARMAGDLTVDPRLADALGARIDEWLEILQNVDGQLPHDLGLAQLAGVGDEAADKLGETRLPTPVTPYDETVVSQRIVAAGDLYYIYQHERIGVFRVVQKLQQLFRAGAVRLSSGDGAFALYQFDRRGVLRYTRADRLSAYRRAFGYWRTAPLAPGARANTEFHPLFVHFVNQVALYWRDKRISDVIRERAQDPSFGSIAIVRRSALDLRNNLKFMSFGHINVLRVEVMQLLEEAFRILGSEDVKRLFGADNAWDVVEEVLARYFRERLVTSPRQAMAVSGREILRWLSQPYILQRARAPFEANLVRIADDAEEWLTSAQSLGLAQRSSTGRVLPFNPQARPPTLVRNGARPAPVAAGG